MGGGGIGLAEPKSALVEYEKGYEPGALEDKPGRVPPIQLPPNSFYDYPKYGPGYGRDPSTWPESPKPYKEFDPFVFKGAGNFQFEPSKPRFLYVDDEKELPEVQAPANLQVFKGAGNFQFEPSKPRFLYVDDEKELPEVQVPANLQVSVSFKQPGVEPVPYQPLKRKRGDEEAVRKKAQKKLPRDERWEEMNVGGTTFQSNQAGDVIRKNVDPWTGQRRTTVTSKTLKGLQKQMKVPHENPSYFFKRENATYQVDKKDVVIGQVGRLPGGEDILRRVSSFL
jgi:hypothetical protein